MEPDIAYLSRHDVLEKARTLRLTAAGLAVEPEGGRPWVMRYADIQRIRLRFFPTRVQSNRFECLVLGRGQELKFSNEFYRGIAQFEDRSADYRAFVTALCARVAAEKPAVEFVTGRERWMLALEYGFLFLMALFLAWILWLTGGPLRWLVWVKLGIVAFFLPTLVRYFRRSGPVRFDPRAIPAAVLPDTR